MKKTFTIQGEGVTIRSKVAGHIYALFTPFYCNCLLWVLSPFNPINLRPLSFNWLVMEIEEIRMVLSRASQLNAKINDAIERAVQVDMNGNKEKFEPGTSSSSTGEQCVVEAKNLISIRHALEVLEEQLECLQALQQQQQAEKEAALSDLEESRRDLLGKLRDYQGREWDIVHEALAFAGETMDEAHDLPLPPYPRLPSTNPSVGVSNEQVEIYYKSTGSARENGALDQLAWRDENYELSISEVDGDNFSQTGEEVIDNKDMEKGHKMTKKIMAIICNNLCRFMGSPVGKVVMVAAKAGLTAAGLIAVLNLSEAGLNKQRKQSLIEAPSSIEKSISDPQAGKNQDATEEKYSPGKVLIKDDIQEYVQKENIELPFEEEETVPNVFYGCG